VGVQSKIILILISCLLVSFQIAAQTESISIQNSNSVLIVPKTGLNASELALIVNDADAQPVEIANYYKMKRGIPEANLIHVNHGVPWIYDVTTFNSIRSQVMNALQNLPNVQALAITWQGGSQTVGAGMSLSSAMTFGYNTGYVGYNRTGTCSMTTGSPYFASSTTRPRSELNLIPTVVMAGGSIAAIKNGIDRGFSSDQTFPQGHGYFVRTADTSRSIRYSDFQATVNSWNRPDALSLSYIDNSNGAYGADYIEGQSSVLFYQTGLTNVPQIDSNIFVPGALADHLTSYAGSLFDNGQMSLVHFLDAGAAASYGTVSEPCSYTSKFPQASILVANYFKGASALEAYSKSVYAPGEGHVAANDPLARPYKTKAALDANNEVHITTTQLVPGQTYTISGSDSLNGTYTTLVSNISVSAPSIQDIQVSGPMYAFYKLATSGGGGNPPPPPPPADTVAPTVSIDSMSVVRRKLQITLSAQDNVLVSRIECYMNGVLKGSDTSAPYSIAIDTKRMSPGTYSVQYRAYDAAGNIGYSSAVSFTN